MNVAISPRFQQRFSAPNLAPPWLKGNNSNAAKYLYVMGYALDLLSEKQNEGMLAKCPGLADDSAIPLQAADRVFVQGPSETNANFVLRMRDFLDAWAKAGSRPGILEQMQAYLTDLQPGVDPDWPEMLIVGGNTDTSIWSTIFGSMAQGAAPARSVVTPANWNWDGLDMNSRAWLVLFMNLVATGNSGTTGSVDTAPYLDASFSFLVGLSGMTSEDVGSYITMSGAEQAGNNGTFQIVSIVSPTSVVIANENGDDGDSGNGHLIWSISAYPYIGPAPVWGAPDKVWGIDTTWGVNCSYLVIESIRQLLKTWKSAATYYPSIIISFGGGDGTSGNDFSPLSSQGAGNPDGTWAGPGKLVNGVWVPARDGVNIFTAYCTGTGSAVQCQEQNVT